MELKGKTAIVTGSAGGIGQGIACVLAREGANVVVNDLREQDCEHTVATIVSRGGRAMAFGADVTARAAVNAMVEATVVPPMTVELMQYDPETDLQPVTMIARWPLLLLTGADLPVDSMAQLASYARAHAGALNYGSHGIGTMRCMSAPASSAVWLRFCAWMSSAATLAPRRSSSSASSRPMPLPAPVTMMTLPATCIGSQ